MSVNASTDLTSTSTPSPTPALPHGSPGALTVYRLAALFTFLTVSMGAVVSATGSGAACPTWPGCRPGDLAPPWALSPIIEFTHRVVAITTGPLVLAAAVVGWRLTGLDRRVRILPWVALAGAIASGAFGRLVVLQGLPAWLGAIDLFCALTAMTAMGVAAVLAARPAANPVPSRVTRIHRTAAAGVSVLIVMHVTGILAAGTGSYTRTVGWPFWRLIASDLHPWLQVVRLVLAGLAAVLVVGAAVSAMGSTRLGGQGTAIVALFVAEMLLSLAIRAEGLTAGLAAAYAVVAVALLSCLGLLAAVTLAAGRPRRRTGGGTVRTH